MRRGEVWLINLDPAIGAEIKKTRPAVIVNDDAIGLLPLKVIVPITAWKDRYSVATWMVQVLPTSENRLEKASTADTFQIRCLAQERFVRKLGYLSDSVMRSIGKALVVVLAIE